MEFSTVGWDEIYPPALALLVIMLSLASLVKPRLQGARDVGLIESEEVGTGEKVAAQAAAFMLLFLGLALFYLVLSAWFKW